VLPIGFLTRIRHRELDGGVYKFKKRGKMGGKSPFGNEEDGWRGAMRTGG